MRMAYPLLLVLSLASVTSYAAQSTVTEATATNNYNSNVAASLDNIADKIRDYKEKNPNANDTELNKYAETLLQTDVKQSPQSVSRAAVSSVYTDMDGYVNGYLNPQENALYNSNRAKALLCMANGKKAISATQERYKNLEAVVHNGNGDAFRHAIWNFGMTNDVGADFAKKWSDAHEYGAVVNNPIERSMDLYNNSIGINLGKNNPTVLLTSTFANLTQQQVRAGKMKVISNGKLIWSDSNGEK